MNDMIPFIEHLARAAGEEAMKYFNHIRENTVYHKGNAKDLVSTADKAVENLIISEIGKHFPEHSIFGEETGCAMQDSAYCWVIDPIDGTLSFVRNQPFFAISIALKKDGIPMYGCVYAPRLDLMFTAERGHGAFENGKQIHVEHCESLEAASGATGFACLRAGIRENNNMPICDRLFPVLQDVKRCGSAAIDLCFVASGRFDLFWELSLKEYDIAAGALIAQESGAVVTDMTGGNDYPDRGIICTNPTLHAQVLPYFSVIKV